MNKCITEYNIFLLKFINLKKRKL